ncbi:MAG: hypothetical protein ACOVNY_01815, partial [Chitinophagaceae bacterium]
PFAGLFLSFFASICITLIAITNQEKSAILKATLAVIAVKFMLSPQSPPMAYVAVLIQGLVGFCFFQIIPNKRIAASILTFFSLVYSALQHLLIVTIVFGKSFWIAMDIFLNGITKNFAEGNTPYSLYIVIAYLSCYVLVGIWGGIMNAKLVSQIQLKKWSSEIVNTNLANIDIPNITAKKHQKKRYTFLLIIAIIILLIWISSYFNATQFINPKNKVLMILLRGFSIIFVWNFIVAPICIRWMQKWVSKYTSSHQNTIQQIMLLIPEMRIIAQYSWQEAKKAHPLKRIQKFVFNLILCTIYTNNNAL